MNLSTEVDRIRAEMFRLRFESELTDLKEQGGEWVEDRIEQLEEILTLLTRVDPDSAEERARKSQQELIEVIEDRMYCKNWARLPNMHKMVQFEKMIDRLGVTRENRAELLIEFDTALRARRYGTSRSVVYDPHQGKLLSIPTLIETEAGYKFEEAVKKRRSRKAKAES